MSEEIINNNQAEDEYTQRWDDIAKDSEWLQKQAEIAKEKGDEATLQKIGRYLQQNKEIMDSILNDTNEDDAKAAEAADATAIEATDTASEEKEADAHIYERTIQNPDGTITHISADTQEEFKEKIREQAEANREAFSRY